jgi:hypothetical protein
MASGFRPGGSVTQALERLHKKILAVCQETGDEVARIAEKDLNEVVSDWKNQPLFVTEYRGNQKGSLVWTINATGDEKAIEIFGYVDQGTEPHIIRPVNASRLRFSSGYQAKTAPIANAQAGSGRSSGDVVFAKEVHHPGTEAREFVGFTALEAELNLMQLFSSNVRKRL